MYYDCNKFSLKLLKLTCHVSVFVVRGCTYFWSSALVPSFTFQSIHCLFYKSSFKICAGKNVLKVWHF